MDWNKGPVLNVQVICVPSVKVICKWHISPVINCCVKTLPEYFIFYEIEVKKNSHLFKSNISTTASAMKYVYIYMYFLT